MDMHALIRTSREAGRLVMEVYRSPDFGVRQKEDQTPVTVADQRSHEFILSRLAEIAPGVAVVSEEGALPPHEKRKAWHEMFLIDPLDGTKEFIRQSGEFTVNIGLLVNKSPSIGIIHLPVLDRTYYASPGQGAWRQDGDKPPVRIAARKDSLEAGLVLATSRSHGLERLASFLNAIPVKERIVSGGAVKFCLVAEGAAHLYPRFGETWEWDTAAGQAILSEAGGLTVDMSSLMDLPYNRPSLKHSGFLAASDRGVLDRVRSALLL